MQLRREADIDKPAFPLGLFLVPSPSNVLHDPHMQKPLTTSSEVLAEQFVTDTLRTMGPCSMDDLFSALPELRWSDVFLAVNRLSRDGRLRLLDVGSSTYVLVADPPPLDTPTFQVPPVATLDHSRSPDPAAHLSVVETRHAPARGTPGFKMSDSLTIAVDEEMNRVF